MVNDEELQEKADISEQPQEQSEPGSTEQSEPEPAEQPEPEVKETVVEAQPEEAAPQEEPTDFNEKQSLLSSKYIVVGAIIVILIFVAIFNITKIYNPEPIIATGRVVSSTELHPTNETATKYTYNDHDFKKISNMWRTEIKKGNRVYDVEFYYGPRELESVPFEGTFNEAFDHPESYVTFNPTDDGLSYIALSVGQLDTSLIKSFGKQLISACSVNETNACTIKPIIDCDRDRKSVV